MIERSFDEMIAYFNRRVSEMDIAQDYKMELLGMVTALGYKHEKSAQQWIPVKWHEITDTEREEEGYSKDWVCVFDSEMPYDGQKILVTTKWFGVAQDECYADGEYALDSGWDWIDDVIAWMPLPEPYKEDE